jgi:hypothetical protein
VELVEAFRVQAEACRRLGSPMYGELLDRLVDDIDGGGPSRDVLAGHEDDPGPSALALRLLGSVHRLVLRSTSHDRPDGDDPAAELAAHYPSVGGTWDLDAAWPVFRRLLADRPDAVREWLDRPPQTNEVGRAAALMGGLLHLDGRQRGLPVRLLEIGASGGLNLLADRFCYHDGSGPVQGDPHSAVQLVDAWRGRSLQPWPGLTVVERSGCDPMPVDVTSDEGALTLTAYVWPDQPARLDRLRGAVRLAAEQPVAVRRQPASDFLAGVEPRQGATTVLWHSVMWQYLPADEKQAVETRIQELAAAATDEAPVVRLSLEPTRTQEGDRHEFLVAMQVWPAGDHRVVGVAEPHGLPTTFL